MSEEQKSGEARRGISRRSVLATAGAGLAAPMLVIPNAWAQGKVLHVSTYTGPQGEHFKKVIIPAFEAKFGCKVYQTENATLANIALLRTQKNNPKLSVVMMDDLGIPIAKAEGLIAKLQRAQVPNLDNVYPRYVFGDSYGSAFAISSIAPFYVKSIGKPIESYSQLWEERFKGRYMMANPKYSQSVCLLMAATSLATGLPIEKAQYEYEKGWTRMAALKANVLTTFDTTGTAVLQLSQGQADVAGPVLSKDIYPYVNRGAPVAVSKPKEGEFAGINCVTLAANAPEPELGAAFIDFLLSASVQKALSEATYAAPSVRNVTLAPEVAQVVASTEDKVNKLIALDWGFINPRRGQILEKFNQIFGS